MIAELDGAYTKYYEATLETEWRERQDLRPRLLHVEPLLRQLRPGQLDRRPNDANIFIGSSNIGDGAGRQLWDFKDGDLRGDRPHMLKVYGYRQLPLERERRRLLRRPVGAAVGDVELRALPQPDHVHQRHEPLRRAGGSRRADSHWQLDLNYTQNFRFGERLQLPARADLFNVFDKQTGYNIEPRVHNSAFGTPRSFFDPRRLQLAARFQF